MKKSVIWLILMLVWASPAAAQGGSGARTLDETMYYYVPTSYDGETAVPLVIVLHPFGSSGRAMAAITGFDAAAEAQGFIVAYPDSATLGWNEGRLERGWADDLPQEDDAANIAAVVDELAAEYRIDQVYLTGLANGGTMAYKLACAMPERFAKAAVVGALMWDYLAEDCADTGPTQPVSMLVMIGDQDPDYPNPYEGHEQEIDDGVLVHSMSRTDTLKFWAERGQCKTVDKDSALMLATDCTEGVQNAVYTIQGAGHNWPRKGDYTLNQFGVDATEEITRFFFADDWTITPPSTAPEVYGGYPRGYTVYVPPSYDGTEAVPVVIALHGRTGSGAGLAYYLDMNPVAAEHNFIMVYPDGIEKQWNITHGFESAIDNGVDDTDFLIKLVDDLDVDLNIDQERVYVVGFSNGGFMTQRVACEAPDEFAGFGVISATLFPEVGGMCITAPPVPLVFVHGTLDDNVTWEAFTYGGRVISLSVPDTITFWALHNQCKADQSDYVVLPSTNAAATTLVYRYTFGGCAEHGDILFYAIQGGGHNIPGRAERFSGAAGAVNTDIKAAEVLWEFFAAHPS